MVFCSENGLKHFASLLVQANTVQYAGGFTRDQNVPVFFLRETHFHYRPPLPFWVVCRWGWVRPMVC